jgi:hypothetical protein
MCVVVGVVMVMMCMCVCVRSKHKGDGLPAYIINGKLLVLLVVVIMWSC